MKYLSSINPLNGSVAGTVEVTPPDEIPDLVVRARDAQRHWVTLGLEGRAELLGKAAQRFVEDAESLGRLMTEEMGKPLKESVSEVRTIGTGLKGELEEIVEALESETFGLGAVVFGTDPTRTEQVARRLTAGMIGINRACGGIKGTPWVGAGESGYGFHKGKDGHRQFTQTRVVSLSK